MPKAVADVEKMSEMLPGRSPGTPFKFYFQPTTTDIGDPADGEDFQTTQAESEVVIEDNSTTRIVLKTDTFPETDGYEGINISGYLCFGKRSRKEKSNSWEDVSHFDLRSLKVGEHVRIKLGPNNLRSLFKALANSYRGLGGLDSILGDLGITVVNPVKSIIVEGQERETLKYLIDNDPDFWQNIVELDTTKAIETKALQEEHRKRLASLEEFRDHLIALDWDELKWQEYFEANAWIFGLGLTYHFLEPIKTQANLGGGDLAGKGEDKLDFLLMTAGDSRFTVLVDIKRPDTELLTQRSYRSNIYRVGSEISGGVSQLHSYCETWQTEGAQQLRNSPAKLGAFTYAPKAMLIAGRLSELGDDDSKRKSFELFRRHVQNPQIITFDELFARAEHHVVQYSTSAPTATT